MHLFRATQNNPARSVLTYSAFHLFRQGKHSFNAGQWLVLACCLCIDFVLFVVAAFSWLMMPLIAILFTLPFVLFTAAILSRLKGK